MPARTNHTLRPQSKNSKKRGRAVQSAMRAGRLRPDTAFTMVSTGMRKETYASNHQYAYSSLAPPKTEMGMRSDEARDKETSYQQTTISAAQKKKLDIVSME